MYPKHGAFGCSEGHFYSLEFRDPASSIRVEKEEEEVYFVLSKNPPFTLYTAAMRMKKRI